MKKKKLKNELDSLEQSRIIYWSPTTGCTQVTIGCKNFYAKVIAEELQREGDPKFVNGFEPTEHEDSLQEPYNYEDHMIVYVSEMSDLFHPKISSGFIKKVFRVMNDNFQHHFVIATKYADRLEKISEELELTKNIIIGVFVESEDYLGRIDLLRKTKAHKKMVLFEPLMGPINSVNLEDIDYVIIAGEIGKRNSRALQPAWLFKLLLICEEQSVTHAVRGWGSSVEVDMFKNLYFETKYD